MFDIVLFNPEKIDLKKLGYEKLYDYSSPHVKQKIIKVKNLAQAVNYKNKEMLIIIEDHDFDDGAIKLIAEKKKACFLIDLSRIINSKGVGRAVAMSKLRNFLKLCNKHGAYYTFADFAKDEFELRSSKELMHISLLLGLNLGQAKFAMKMLKSYLD
ncbi:MAG: hypothetical protein AABX38_07725 [Candidatus Micrarchaeota archaeon]